MDLEVVTKQVLVLNSGKIQGIKGLYKDLSSGRFYVRYSRHGVDKQLTVYPKNPTFSGLEKAAAKGLNELKKQVKSLVCDDLTSACSEKDRVERAADALVLAIQSHWAKRGTTEKHIMRLLQFTRGMCICKTENKKLVSFFDAHNIGVAREIVEGDSLSIGQRAEAYKSIQFVFDELIHIGMHHGCNPAYQLIKPKYAKASRESELNFDDAARVIHFIRHDDGVNPVRRAEAELFLRLCIETGQRPIDVHMWNVSRIIPGNHYQFMSHKTGRKHRIKHLISKQAIDLANTIALMRGGVVEFHHALKNKFGNDEPYQSFWMSGQKAYVDYLNAVIKKVVGGDKSLYCARHFFISEIFRMTNSEFWAELFTHEGKTANTRHYLHASQDEADRLLGIISGGLDLAISAQ